MYRMISCSHAVHVYVHPDCLYFQLGPALFASISLDEFPAMGAV